MKKLALSLLLVPAFVYAADAEFTLTIEDNRFAPPELRVPAGKKIKLVVDNRDASPEELESYELNREKVVAANSRGTLFIGPLAPGRYPFFGDFHKDTARGAIVAE